MLTLEEGKLLVKIARNTMEEFVRNNKAPPVPDVPAKFREPRGVFVSLKKRGELRGCIGIPFPTLPLVDALVDATISSATRDPRFPAVRPRELEEIELEVSVLTEPETINVKHPKEYPKHVVVGKDGLIVERGGFSGLLLPQVAVEYGWDAEEFLSNTCIKAGLTPDAWLDKDVNVKKFSAQVFAEKSPGGEIEERRFK